MNLSVMMISGRGFSFSRWDLHSGRSSRAVQLMSFRPVSATVQANRHHEGGGLRVGDELSSVA